jgi:multidrug efflux pump subunit AcrA (membrane-fusion protein)
MQVVPASAILHGDTGAFVFVEKAKGEFGQVQIRVGETRGGLVAISSGLEVGDRVVVEGAILLRSQ